MNLIDGVLESPEDSEEYINLMTGYKERVRSAKKEIERIRANPGRFKEIDDRYIQFHQEEIQHCIKVFNGINEALGVDERLEAEK